MSNSNAEKPVAMADTSVADVPSAPLGGVAKTPEPSGHEQVAVILRDNGVQKEAIDIILENRINSNDLEAFDEEDLVDLNMTKAHAKRIVKLKPKICGGTGQVDVPESRPR